MGEFFLELLVEIVGEVFIESQIDLSRSKYVPKWLRITAITIVAGLFGGILLLIIWGVFDSGKLLIAAGIIIAAVWLFLVIKALTIKTKKFEYVSLDDNNTFKGRRTYLGLIIGKVSPKNISQGLNENKEIKVSFRRTVEFPENEQLAVIEEKEIQILKELYNMPEDKFSILINRARCELMKKLSRKDTGYSNGSSIVLEKIYYDKSPDEYMVNYYFKDKKTGKKIKIEDILE